MQTSSARNVASCHTVSDTEAPGPYFRRSSPQRLHQSLKQLVHFYNTRDVAHFSSTSLPGTADRNNGKGRLLAYAEVPNNIDMTIGKLA